MELSSTGMAALQYATYVLEVLGVALATVELVWPSAAASFATYVREDLGFFRAPLRREPLIKLSLWLLVAIGLGVGFGSRFLDVDNELRLVLAAVILSLPLAQIVAVRVTPGREIAGYGLTIAFCGLFGEGLSMFVFS